MGNSARTEAFGAAGCGWLYTPVRDDRPPQNHLYVRNVPTEHHRDDEDDPRQLNVPLSGPWTATLAKC